MFWGSLRKKNLAWHFLSIIEWLYRLHQMYRMSLHNVWQSEQLKTIYYCWAFEMWDRQLTKQNKWQKNIEQTRKALGNEDKKTCQRTDFDKAQKYVFEYMRWIITFVIYKILRKSVSLLYFVLWGRRISDVIATWILLIGCVSLCCRADPLTLTDLLTLDTLKSPAVCGVQVKVMNDKRRNACF